MADRALAISTRSGIGAAAVVAALVLLAFLAVASEAEPGPGLSASDWAALRFTVTQAALSAVFSVVLAIPLSRALSRRQFPGRSALIILLGAPFILPVIVAVLGLLAVFGRTGWVNVVLDAMGLPQMSIYGLHGVVLAHVFFNLPLATRLLLQAWQTVPAERFRLAAQLDLGPFALLRAIEWPLLRQTVPGALALVFVICLTSFAVALTLGGGPGATTLELAIYQAFRFDFDLSRAAYLSLLQLGVAGGAAVLALRLIPPMGFGGGLDRPVRRWDGAGLIPRMGDAGLILMATLFLVLPLAAVVLRGVAGIFQLPGSVLQAAGFSLITALASVVIMLVLALPISGWIASQRRGGVEAVGLLGLSASPLMIGTGWFILINPLTDPTLLALPVTALVNALIALPFALRILVPRIRDTAETYGRLSQSLRIAGWSLWRWVILPRLWVQLGFAAGLTAALSMGDLGVIALFADPDRVTLPLQMYRLMGAYRMDAAAGAGLVLLVLSLGLFWLFERGGRLLAET